MPAAASPLQRGFPPRSIRARAWAGWCGESLRGRPTCRPTALCGLHPCLGALADQEGTLELRQNAHDMEGEPSPGGGSADALRGRLKPRAAFPEVGNELDQTGQQAVAAVEPPYNEHIPSTDTRKRVRKDRPNTVLPGNAVVILEDVVALDRFERMALKVKILFVDRDAGVADFHVSDFAAPFCRVPVLCKSGLRKLWMAA